MKQPSTLLLVVFCLLLPLAFALAPAQQPHPTTTKPGRKVSSEIENPAGLESFFEALAAIQAGRQGRPVRVMHFGDSHTAVDILTAEIRRRLQMQFGDGGPGLIVPRNPMSTRRRGVSSGATAGWIIEGIGGRIPADRILGPAGISLSTSAANEQVWLETAANHFEIYYVRQPGGGQLQVLVDGVSVVPRPLSLSSTTSRFASFVYDTSTDQNHRLELQTAGTGRVRLLGIVAEHQSGVTYDQLGINGARAARMLGWNAEALTAALAQRKPDLIIVAYGTNELTDSDWTATGYRHLLSALLRDLKAAVPDASILVCGPPDRADSALASARLPSLVNAERKAALSAGAAFWSSYDAMGGANSMSVWVDRGLGQGDRVHLTSAGYQRLAGQFYQALMRAYAASR
jgi:lysophospholipase L1-like esterase